MRYIIVFLAFLQANVALAAPESSVSAGSISSTNTTASKLEDVTPGKKFEADKRITDLELKAAVGSMSRWSLKGELGYTGPAINALHDQDRPNPNNSVGDMRTYLSGAFGARYRMNPADTISFGAGVNWYNPIETASGKPVDKVPRAADDVSIASPRISYDHSYVAWGLQMRNNYRATWITDSQYMRSGQRAGVSFSHNLKYNVGTTRLTLGFESAPAWYIYNREWMRKDGNSSNYYIGFYPNASYRLLSNLDATTSLGYGFKSLRRERGNNWRQDMVTGRFGLGWSITREIYVNPYINMFTQNPNIDTTTVALGTVFSIF